MQELNAAFSLITGVDASSLDFVESDVTYFRRTEPDYVIDVEGFQISVTRSSGYAQDWVYGASFAPDGCGAYLATYSGKVVQISDKGIALRVYDLGSIADEIVDTGDFLYLLTRTRLYVIESGTILTNFLDVYDQGRLIVTKLGFGLVAGKRFQWFNPNGGRIGELKTKHPIRTIYSSGNTTVIETRQHRAVIEGLKIA
jgi:hypothetical protein